MTLTASKYIIPITLILSLIIVSGCGNVRDMKDGARLKPYEACPVLHQDQSASEPLQGVVAQTESNLDPAFLTGKINGRFTKGFPIELNMDFLKKGREEYRVYCSVCHDDLGSGRGVIIEKGFREPFSFHEARLRTAPPGYIYDVITSGYVTMASYANDIPPEDRWAIAAYIKALQISRNVSIDELPEKERANLTGEAR